MSRGRWGRHHHHHHHQESLQHLDGRAEEGDWAVTIGLGRGFAEFEDRDNYCMFPNGGYFTVIEGEVEKVGEELDAMGTKVLEMEDGKTIRSSSAGIAAVPDGLTD